MDVPSHVEMSIAEESQVVTSEHGNIAQPEESDSTMEEFQIALSEPHGEAEVAAFVPEVEEHAQPLAEQHAQPSAEEHVQPSAEIQIPQPQLPQPKPKTQAKVPASKAKAAPSAPAPLFAGSSPLDTSFFVQHSVSPLGIPALQAAMRELLIPTVQVAGPYSKRILSRGLINAVFRPKEDVFAKHVPTLRDFNLIEKHGRQAGTFFVSGACALQALRRAEEICDTMATTTLDNCSSLISGINRYLRSPSNPSANELLLPLDFSELAKLEREFGELIRIGVASRYFFADAAGNPSDDDVPSYVKLILKEPLSISMAAEYAQKILDTEWKECAVGTLCVDAATGQVKKLPKEPISIAQPAAVAPLPAAGAVSSSSAAVDRSARKRKKSSAQDPEQLSASLAAKAPASSKSPASIQSSVSASANPPLVTPPAKQAKTAKSATVSSSSKEKKEKAKAEPMPSVVPPAPPIVFATNPLTGLIELDNKSRRVIVSGYNRMIIPSIKQLGHVSKILAPAKKYDFNTATLSRILAMYRALRLLEPSDDVRTTALVHVAGGANLEALAANTRRLLGLSFRPETLLNEIPMPFSTGDDDPEFDFGFASKPASAATGGKRVRRQRPPPPDSEPEDESIEVPNLPSVHIDLDPSFRMVARIMDKLRRARESIVSNDSKSEESMEVDQQKQQQQLPDAELQDKLKQAEEQCFASLTRARRHVLAVVLYERNYPELSCRLARFAHGREIRFDPASPTSPAGTDVESLACHFNLLFSNLHHCDRTVWAPVFDNILRSERLSRHLAGAFLYQHDEKQIASRVLAIPSSSVSTSSSAPALADEQEEVHEEEQLQHVEEVAFGEQLKEEQQQEAPEQNQAMSGEMETQ